MKGERGMNFETFLNSRFGVALAIAGPFAVPFAILAYKEPKAACEVFNKLVDTFKEKFISQKSND